MQLVNTRIRIQGPVIMQKEEIFQFNMVYLPAMCLFTKGDE